MNINGFMLDWVILVLLELFVVVFLEDFCVDDICLDFVGIKIVLIFWKGFEVKW